MLFSEVNKSSENVFQNFPLPAFSSFDASAGCILTGLHTYKTNTIKMNKYKANTIPNKYSANQTQPKLIQISEQVQSLRLVSPQFSNPSPFPAKMSCPPLSRDQTKILLNPSFLHQINVFLSLSNALPNISVFFNQRWELLMTIIVGNGWIKSNSVRILQNCEKSNFRL